MSNPRQESEGATRRRRIDPMLTRQGWIVVPYVPGHPTAAYSHHAVTEYPTANGPADYALFVDGVLLGIVEAKRLTLGPQSVLTQAERYSRGATGSPWDFRGFRVPFLYATNGEVLWFHDVRHPLNRSRRVAGFHTPAALVQMLARDFEQACRWFGEHANDHPRLRPYQIEANRAIEEAIARRLRLMLVAMATGTGKTFTMVNHSSAWSILSRAPSSSTTWRTSGNSTPRKSSGPSPRPIPTARSWRRSRSTPWSTSGATAAFPRR
jgi:type I restriction enzyme R subunit